MCGNSYSPGTLNGKVMSLLVDISARDIEKEQSYVNSLSVLHRAVSRQVQFSSRMTAPVRQTLAAALTCTVGDSIPQLQMGKLRLGDDTDLLKVIHLVNGRLVFNAGSSWNLPLCLVLEGHATYPPRHSNVCLWTSAAPAWGMCLCCPHLLRSS